MPILQHTGENIFTLMALTFTDTWCRYSNSYAVILLLLGIRHHLPLQPQAGLREKRTGIDPNEEHEGQGLDMNKAHSLPITCWIIREILFICIYRELCVS